MVDDVQRPDQALIVHDGMIAGVYRVPKHVGDWILRSRPDRRDPSDSGPKRRVAGPRREVVSVRRRVDEIQARVALI